MSALDLSAVTTGSDAVWLDRYRSVVMGTYGVPPRVLVRGEGCYVWDADGRRYLDLLAGIAVNALGHAHPFLVSAVTSQLATLGHVSNLFANPLQVALAERLLTLLDAPQGSAVFFCNSGAEATEAAIKMSRKTGRSGLVAAQNGFHGRTMGALALTHKPAYRLPFEPLPGDVVHVPFGDVAALEAAISAATAAVVLEPIQGEGGVNPAPQGYLAAARALTEQHGSLLVLDEVQTGVGRTGAWFAFQRPELSLGGGQPDVVTLAKGLGGGIPIGAAVAFGTQVAQLLSAGQHGTTFGGNPVAAAAGLATLHVIERDHLVRHADDIGTRLRTGIEGLSHPLVEGVRGHGLLLAMQLTQPVAADVCAALLEAGFIVNPVAPSVIRLAPPLIVTAEQADTLIGALGPALDAAERRAAR